ncbi:hypothetical protein M0R45_027684 [Rubus argutus]|uniref:Endonuclease/exonuclease/phosphatase domain-containing protein n=2 Tax=Rubus argutus TaxID=59490 RepID=A0AAW1X192_RUBAR
MRIVTWNVRGLGSKRKRSMIRNLVVSSGADIIILQETKMAKIERRLVSSIWGVRFKEWVSIPAIGRSGGLVVIWNTRSVSVLESLVGLFSVSIKMKGMNGIDWWLTGVYGSNGYRERVSFWEELASLYGLCGPRLDRFLFSTGWEDVFSDARQLALTRVTSDHCPVLLDTNIVKWGPAPFRFENMWLEHPSFKENFKIWWEEEIFQGWEGF